MLESATRAKNNSSRTMGNKSEGSQEKKKKLKKKKGEGSVKRWEGLQPGRERIEWIVYQAEGTSRNRETDTIIKTI